MARKDAKRVVVTLRSTEGTGSTYTTTKNRANQRERLELRKYDPKLRRVALFREAR
ncbi:MAG: 50S ribosomal protein L33 [Nitriliruptor sp.]|nr:MAG: 50S ribosomal protein L33 [Nitriliruptor sp.]